MNKEELITRLLNSLANIQSAKNGLDNRNEALQKKHSIDISDWNHIIGQSNILQMEINTMRKEIENIMFRNISN